MGYYKIVYGVLRVLTIEHVHPDACDVRVGGAAGVLARVGGHGVLDQQVGGGGLALVRDDRHSPPRGVVADHLQTVDCYKRVWKDVLENIKPICMRTNKFPT